MKANFSANVILKGFTLTDYSNCYALKDGTFICLSCPDGDDNLNLIKVHTPEGVTFSYDCIKGVSVDHNRSSIIIHTHNNDSFLIELDDNYTINFDYYNGTLHAYCTRG